MLEFTTRRGWGERTWGWWAIIGFAGACVIGGFGPWATVFGAFNVSGTRGAGWYVIGAGIVSTAVLLISDPQDSKPRLQWAAWVVLIAGLVAAGVSVYEWVNIESLGSKADQSTSSFFDLSNVVNTAWGLWISAAASVGLISASILRLFALRVMRRQAAADPPFAPVSYAAEPIEQPVQPDRPPPLFAGHAAAAASAEQAAGPSPVQAARAPAAEPDWLEQARAAGWNPPPGSVQPESPPEPDWLVQAKRAGWKPPS